LRARPLAYLNEPERLLQQPVRVGHGDGLGPTDGDRFEPLGAHNGAVAGAAYLPSVVVDHGIAHQVLTRGPNGADADVLVPQVAANGLLRLDGAHAQIRGGIEELHVVVVDKEHAPARGGPLDDQSIPAGALEHLREVTARERVPDKTSQWRLGRHAMLGAYRHGGARKGAAGKTESVVGTEGVAAPGCVVVHQAAGKPHTPQVLFQKVGADLLHPRLRGGHVDMQNPAAV